MYCNFRHVLVRVVRISSRKRVAASFDGLQEDGQILMATAKSTLLKQLLALKKDGEHAEIFANPQQACNDKRVGLPIQGPGDVISSWADLVLPLLSAAGLKTSMVNDDRAQLEPTVVFDMVMKVAKRKKCTLASNTRGEEYADQDAQGRLLKAIDKRAFEASLTHWPRDKARGVFYAFKPAKPCPSNKQGQEWNVKICKVAYMSTFTKLCDVVYKAEGSRDKRRSREARHQCQLPPDAGCNCTPPPPPPPPSLAPWPHGTMLALVHGS